MNLKKLLGKSRGKSQSLDFEKYLENFSNKYIFEKYTDYDEKATIIPWDDKIKKEIKVLWSQYADKQKTIELYTALQLLVQQAAESLILLDRVYFLKEKNCSAYLTSVMNKSLSPRCCAIVARKKNT